MVKIYDKIYILKLWIGFYYATFTHYYIDSDSHSNVVLYIFGI